MYRLLVAGAGVGVWLHRLLVGVGRLSDGDVDRLGLEDLRLGVVDLGLRDVL